MIEILVQRWKKVFVSVKCMEKPIYISVKDLKVYNLRLVSFHHSLLSVDPEISLILVTGGTGLGKGMSLKFAELGAKVNLKLDLALFKVKFSQSLTIT